MINKFVCFRVRATTEFYQEVRIVGDIPELGNWDPNKGLVL